MCVKAFADQQPWLRMCKAHIFNIVIYLTVLLKTCSKTLHKYQNKAETNNSAPVLIHRLH